MYLKLAIFAPKVAMRITLVLMGKTDASWLKSGIDVYTKRLSHYIRFDVVEINPPKNYKQLNPLQLKEAEGKLFLKYFEEADQVILLDERGKMHSSEDFAAWLQKLMNAGTRHLMFVVGGASIARADGHTHYRYANTFAKSFHKDWAAYFYQEFNVDGDHQHDLIGQIGRASCRERV